MCSAVRKKYFTLDIDWFKTRYNRRFVFFFQTQQTKNQNEKKKKCLLVGWKSIKGRYVQWNNNDADDDDDVDDGDDDEDDKNQGSGHKTFFLIVMVWH